jgi:hypothetical protein
MNLLYSLFPKNIFDYSTGKNLWLNYLQNLMFKWKDINIFIKRKVQAVASQLE